MKNSKDLHLFETEIFCNINVIFSQILYIPAE